MIVTATEFKSNFGRYLELAATQDVFITKNGRSIAKLTNPNVDKLSLLDSIVGVAPEIDIKDKDIKAERMRRQ